MRIAGTDTPVRDLTRWNRAGLDRMRYVEGGAAEWLEYLRVCHMLLYAQDRDTAATDDPDVWRAAFETGALPGNVDVGGASAALRSLWQLPGPRAYSEANADYRTALRAQYDHVPLDQTAQISRAFVRALHILTESLDAYANEGFLPTATQEPHLRRLLELIDFRPRLAASATMPVALILAEDQPRQTIERGLAIEWMPTDGTPILTYESLSALVVDPAANTLRPSGWEERNDPVAPETGVFELADPTVLNVALTGTAGVLTGGPDAQGLKVTAARKSDGTVTVARGGPAGFAGTTQAARLLMAPTFSAAARPNGSDWLHFETVSAAYVGQVVSLVSRTRSASGDIAFATGGTGDAILRQSLGTAFTAIADLEIVPSASGALGFVAETLATVIEVRGRDVRLNRTVPGNLLSVYPAIRSVVVRNPPGHPEDALDVLVLGPYVTPEDAEPIGTLDTLSADRVYLDAPLPDGARETDAVALTFGDGMVVAATLSGLVNAGADGFSFAPSLPAGRRASAILSVALDFEIDVGLAHETRSSQPLFPPDAMGALDVAASAALDTLLVPGRLLLIAPDPKVARTGDPGPALAVTIATAERRADALRLTFREDVSTLSDLTRGAAVIYGNVPLMGHGKSLPETVLGSGDATLAMQAMPLPSGEIATRPDPDFPGGAAPDLEIHVGARKVRLVGSVAEADPLQPSCTALLAEDGTAEILFLSRLSTDVENVRLTRFRKGGGAAGNAVPRYAISKTVPKTPVVAAVVQPLSPQFGADAETSDDLRAKGGSAFALADRALSARDFARLAEGLGMVWHARADLRRVAGAGGRARVVLTVVPAGGGSVEPLRDDVTAYLTDRSLPGTRIEITPFRPAPVGGVATIALKPGFARDEAIAGDIRDTLVRAFGLEARGLGRILFVTELTAAIEAHEAVENLTFTLDPLWSAADPPRTILSTAGAIQAVVPAADTSVFIRAHEDVRVRWRTEGGP